MTALAKSRNIIIAHLAVELQQSLLLLDRHVRDDEDPRFCHIA